MERAIGVCREQGYAAVILVGDLDYYERFGFKPTGDGRFQLPGPVDQNRVLIRDLSERALALRSSGRSAFQGALSALRPAGRVRGQPPQPLSAPRAARRAS